jgi:hypothetical protein
MPEGFRWCPECKTAVAHEDDTRNSRTASGFTQQGDARAMCGHPGPQHLDHDHETGGIRQLSCQRCNHELGLFRDDPTYLHAAAHYVALHSARQAVAADLAAAVSGP